MTPIQHHAFHFAFYESGFRQRQDGIPSVGVAVATSLVSIASCGSLFDLRSFLHIQIIYSAHDRQAAPSRIEDQTMQLITVKIEKPDDTNFILGQTHFIKSVEDIHEALVGAVPGIKFGLSANSSGRRC
jgi:hypothetical protein